MATTPTLIGPVGTRQVNRNLYAGMADLTTIQKAVTAAVAFGGGCVIIPAGYAGSDSIAALTGGNASVYLSDQRSPQQQNYAWSGSAFVPAGIHEKGNITSDGEVIATIVTATATQGAVAQPQTTYLEYAHTPNEARLVGNGPDPATIAGMRLDGNSSDNSLTINYLEMNPTGATFGVPLTTPTLVVNVGMSTPNITTGQAIIDTLTVNNATQLGDVSLTGDLTVSGAVTATNADFETCEVNSSPVRTFANTPDGPGQGMVWPPDGVAVSLGDHWQNPSIDPATLARIDSNNMLSASGVTGSFEVDAQLATPLLAFVDRAPGWGMFARFSISGSQPVLEFGGSIPSLKIVGGLIADNATVNGDLTATGNVFAAPNNGAGFTTPAASNTIIARNIKSGNAETDFINSHGVGPGGGFSWYNVPINTTITASTATAMTLDSANNLTNAGTITTTASNGAAGVTTPTGLAAAIIARNIRTGNDETDFINSHVSTAGGGFSWFNVPAGTAVVASTAPAMLLDSANTLTVNGQVNTTAPVTAPAYKATGAIPSSGVGISEVVTGIWSGTPAIQMINSAGAANSKYTDIVTTPTSINFRFADDAIAAANAFITVTRSGFVPQVITMNAVNAIINNPANGNGLLYLGQANTNLQGDGAGNMAINPTGAGSILMNWNNPGSAGGTIWGNGSGGSVGGMTRTGTFTAVTKSFRIINPLDPTKILNHGSLEGPEFGVYYRGEGQTDSNGISTITLPDYFEALTLPDRRTVQLTEMFEDDEIELGKLAASRVKDGQFRVRSEFASTKFYWEVKAIRADIAELEVVTDQPEEPEMQMQPTEPAKHSKK